MSHGLAPKHGRAQVGRDKGGHLHAQGRRRTGRSAFRSPRPPAPEPVRVYFVDPDTL